MTLLSRTEPEKRVTAARRPLLENSWTVATLAVAVGVGVGVLVGMGGPAVLLPLVALLGLVGVLAHPRRPGLLPLLALAAAATPPLLILPLMVSVGGKSLYLSDLLLPLVAVLALTRRTRIPRGDLVVWAYASVIAFQAAVGLVHHQPFEAFTQELRGPAYLVCGFFIASRLFTFAHARSTLAVSGVVLWFSAGFMVATIVTGMDFLSGRSEEVRAYQAGGGAVEVDAVRFIVNSKGLAFVVLVVAVLVLMSRGAARRARLVAAVLAVPAFLVTFLAYARATVLALGVVVLVLVLVRHGVRLHRRRTAVLVLLLAALVGAVGLSGTGSTLSDPEGGAVARQVAGFEERVIGGLGEEAAESPGNRYRLLENRYAVESWLRSPLVGHGIGAEFKPATFADPSLRAFQDNTAFGVRFLHNGWLWYLVKTGLVGAVAFALLLFVPVFGVLGRRSRQGAGGSRAVDVGLAASIVGLAVIHVFEPDLHRVGTAPVAGAILGYLALRSARSCPSARLIPPDAGTRKEST